MAMNLSIASPPSPFELLPQRSHAEGLAQEREEGPLAPSLRAPSRSVLRAKRFIDIVGATGGLLLLSPLLLAIAVLIRLQSAGPVLFWQLRIGQRGRPFWFLKFRTMVPDAEAQLPHLEAQNESECGVLFKIRDDPRVTCLGRFLRRSSLDELPQLFNILKGEMSLVGPRPLQLRDSERLRLRDPVGYARRLSVPAGLTGAWQIGGRSDTDSGMMTRLDLDYIERMSVGQDLAILCQTVVVVLRGRGAY